MANISDVLPGWTGDIPGGTLAMSMTSPTNVRLIGTNSLHMLAEGYCGANWKTSQTTGSTFSPTVTSSWGWEAVVTGSQYVGFLCHNLNKPTATVRILVDGIEVPMPTERLAQLRSADSAAVVVNFDDANPHTIRVMGDELMLQKAIYLVGADCTLTPTPTTQRLMVVGDSLTGGHPQNSGRELGTWLTSFAEGAGFGDYWNDGQPGTGPHTANDGLQNYKTRTSSGAGSTITTAAPDVLIIGTWVNDWGHGRTAAQIAADMDTAIMQAKALPKIPKIVVLGGIDSGGAPSISMLDTAAAVKSVAAIQGVTHIDPLTGEVHESGTLLGNTGGQWITTANRGPLIGADDLHPTDAGHAHIAAQMVSAWAIIESGPPPVAPNKLRVWDGSEFVECVPHYWGGSGFAVPSSAWAWSGGQWVEVHSTA